MIELIPAIDLIDGKCVRLTKGDYATQKTYNEDPVAVAREFESYGFKRLHVVDLDGARSKHIVNHKVLERLASSSGLAQVHEISPLYRLSVLDIQTGDDTFCQCHTYPLFSAHSANSFNEILPS